ncbi:MAG TPA: glyceraldehyde 3-phosphate dehydrogenase NAD-binding domain-containing protein [Hanamia sp.]|nr:glyceraldehyde 3-phosphate dehydrogenase NAD-binding domain-containing protein [Hanamia sp.]
MRIAINGMGRIGRLLFRRLIDDKEMDLIAVNDIMPIENLAYLLKYDSVYGTFSDQVKINGQSLTINKKEIAVLLNPDPKELPWKDLNIDVVLECSGKFSDKVSASKHLKAGAKKVLLSTTGAEDIPLLVFGHNQNGTIDNLNILSPGGCMTNCSVHILYILNSIGIRSAHINILHSYTSRQSLVDSSHKQLRRGRAAAESIIPVAIDLDKSLNRLLPSLQNKINVFSTRVPVANGAMAEFTVQLKSETSTSYVNKLFKTASQNEYKGILDYTEEQLVSLDIKGNTHSCIIDATQTSVIENHARVVAWFDNEYGFTSRMIDWLRYWAH